MILKDSIRRVQSENEQDQWYMSITDAALYIAIGGFINEANLLLEGLWKHKIPHDRTTWLPDIAFEMLWYAAGNRPVSAPFPKPDIDELELSHRDYMVMPLWASQYANTFDVLDPFSKGMVLMATKDGKFPPEKKEQEALNQFKLYFESTADRPAYSVCKGLSMATELASRIGEEDFAIDLLKKWAGKFNKYPYNNAVVLIGCNRHIAHLLLKGVIAKELELTKKICDSFVEEAISTIEYRVKNGPSFVFGDLDWPDLIKKLSILTMQNEPDLFTNEQKLNKWIGKHPAGHEAIKAKEEELGIVLPYDYKQFLLISNGLPKISIINPELLPVEKIRSIRDAYLGNLELFEITKSYPGKEGEDFGSIVESGFLISEVDESEIWLIPPYSDNKEWECWEFSASNPGERRFTNFRYYIENQIMFFERY
jgi:hypothetical protein